MKFTYTTNARPVDGYTIRRGLHRGGFGEVYYAVSDAGKEVALKLLTNDLDTELRGIRQCLNLKHPNLVTIFDVRTDAEGDSWVVMEYVSGASLEDVLAAFPNGLPRDEVRDWMTGILAGVDYLHGRGIVHRDLKPANIYRENGVVKIGDVGLSKQMGGTRRQHTEAVGTVYYMAPEVARGQYGPEVDVYSLGVMLYELITGRLPFDGETTAEILMKHLANQPDLSEIPASLRPVVAKALEKDPVNRIRSARQFHELLSKVWTVQPLPDSAFEPQTGGDTNRQAAAHGQNATNGQQAAAGGDARDPASGNSQACDPFGKHRQAAYSCTSKGDVRQLVDDVLGRVKTRVRETVDDALEKEWMFNQKWKEERQRREEKRLRRVEESRLKAARKDAERAAKAARKESQRVARMARAEWGQTGTSGRAGWWIALVVLMVLFVPWHRISWNEAVSIVGFGFVLSYVGYRLTRPYHAPEHAGWSLYQPATPLSQGETLAWSWLLAAIVAPVIMVGWLIGWSLQNREWSWRISQGDPDAQMVWIALTIWLAATTIVTAFHLLCGPGADGVKRHEMSSWTMSWVLLVLGLVTGAVVYGLSQFLDVLPYMQGPARPMFRQIGSHLLESGGRSTISAYMLFFGIIFWMQDCWSLKASRQRRMKLRPVFWAAFAGWLGSIVTGLPIVYCVLWSSSITVTAQIAAPWQPGGERRVPVTTAV